MGAAEGLHFEAEFLSLSLKRDPILFFWSGAFLGPLSTPPIKISFPG
jgi:hypothetical protein